MVKVSALYGHPQDPDAFEKYYASTHVPLAQTIPHLQRIDLAKVVATPDGSDPPYYRTADLWFDDMEQMQDGLSSPEGKATAKDFDNFASGGVTLLISQVSPAP